MTELRADGVAVYVRRGSELLQLRRCDPDDAYCGTWQPVYGGIEPGETAPQAALRELQEETGLRPRALFQVEFIETFYFRPGDRVILMPVFAAEVDGDPVVDGEHDAFRWVPMADFEEHFMWRSQRDAIRVLIDQTARGGAAHRLLQVPLD